MPATRRNKQQRKAEDDEDDDDRKLSQETQNSDDTGAMQAVAKQMQAQWDKKKKEKETRFLALVAKELQKTHAQKLDNFAATSTELETRWTAFLEGYAGLDDSIRNLWTQIHAQQDRLHAVSERLRAQQSERLIETEREKHGPAAGQAHEDLRRTGNALAKPM